MVYDKISDKDLEPYIKGLKELDGLGVDFIVMVCNTIHLFYDKLQEQIHTTILDLREELRKLLLKNNIKTATILGTQNTIKRRLYEFDCIRYTNPTENELHQLSSTIFNFNRGIKKKEQVEIVRNIYMKYSKKVDVIILGCTEFGVMLGREKNAVNTIDILVNAVIDKIEKF